VDRLFLHNFNTGLIPKLFSAYFLFLTVGFTVGFDFLPTGLPTGFSSGG